MNAYFRNIQKNRRKLIQLAVKRAVEENSTFTHRDKDNAANKLFSEVANQEGGKLLATWEMYSSGPKWFDMFMSFLGELDRAREGQAERG